MVGYMIDDFIMHNYTHISNPFAQSFKHYHIHQRWVEVLFFITIFFLLQDTKVSHATPIYIIHFYLGFIYSKKITSNDTARHKKLGF